MQALTGHYIWEINVRIKLYDLLHKGHFGLLRPLLPMVALSPSLCCLIIFVVCDIKIANFLWLYRCLFMFWESYGIGCSYFTPTVAQLKSNGEVRIETVHIVEGSVGKMRMCGCSDRAWLMLTLGLGSTLSTFNICEICILQYVLPVFMYAVMLLQMIRLLCGLYR